MAKLTREQLNRWNAKAKNDFMLDIEYFLTWNEKILIKRIKQNDGCIIQFKLWYMPEYEEEINSYGCRWNTRTGRQIPMMRIEKLTPGHTKGIYIVTTIKDNKQVADAEKTKKFATLCRISGEVNIDEELKAIA